MRINPQSAYKLLARIIGGHKLLYAPVGATTGYPPAVAYKHRAVSLVGKTAHIACAGYVYLLNLRRAAGLAVNTATVCAEPYGAVTRFFYGKYGIIAKITVIGNLARGAEQIDTLAVGSHPHAVAVGTYGHYGIVACIERACRRVIAVEKSVAGGKHVQPVAVGSEPHISETVLKHRLDGLVRQPLPGICFARDIGEADLPRRTHHGILHLKRAYASVFGGNPQTSVAALGYVEHIV